MLYSAKLHEVGVFVGDVESGVEHLSQAVAVCSQPQQLLQVLQQTLPPQVFQLMLQRLPAVTQVCVLFSMNWVWGVNLELLADSGPYRKGIIIHGQERHVSFPPTTGSVTENKYVFAQRQCWFVPGCLRSKNICTGTAQKFYIVLFLK